MMTVEEHRRRQREQRDHVLGIVLVLASALVSLVGLWLGAVAYFG